MTPQQRHAWQALSIGPRWIDRADTARTERTAVENSTPVVPVSSDSGGVQGGLLLLVQEMSADGLEQRLLDAILGAIAPPGDGLAIAVRCLSARDPAQVAQYVSMLRPAVLFAMVDAAAALFGRMDQSVQQGEPGDERLQPVRIVDCDLDVVMSQPLSHLLRHPQARAGVWRDLCLARATIRATNTASESCVPGA